MIVQVHEWMLLLCSFALSAFFSASEAALVSISVDRTKQLIELGGAKGRAFKFLSEHPNDILTTILVGNNFVNIFAASYSTSIAQRYFQNNALAISVGVVTFLILIFGEIMPKTLARATAERVSYPMIMILRMLFYTLFPVIRPLTLLVVKLLGKHARLTGRIVTQNDIEYMVNKAEQQQTIDAKQLDLLNSILEFPTIKVKDIMVPRQKIVSVQASSGFAEVINVIKEHNHSRYPVCNGEIDKTVGLLHVKDLAFVSSADVTNFDLTRYLKTPFFVYEHMRIQSVFDYMNRNKVHLALVKDENGLVVGGITLEDIMEEIFGDIIDEHDDEEDIEEHDEDDIKDGGIEVEADILIRDLYNEYDLKIPLNHNFSTLRGFILDQLGDKFPKANHIIHWESYNFELIEVVNKEILKIRITYCPMASNDNSENPDEKCGAVSAENSEKALKSG